MAVLAPAQVAALVKQYFGDLGPQVVAEMTAIALAESGGNTAAVNRANQNGTTDTGLMQINSAHGYDPATLLDPAQNMAAARRVYDAQGPEAWATYADASFRQTWAPAVAAVAPLYVTTGGQRSTVAATIGNDVRGLLGGSNVVSPTTMTAGNQPAGGIDVASGTGIAALIASILQQMAGNNLTGQQAVGAVDPAFLGNQAAAVPTLARQQFEAQKAQADQQYALELKQYGLSVAQFNYQQRLGDAQQKLDTVTKMAALSGPRDEVAYQYALKGMAAPAPAPAGQAGGGADTGLLSGSVNQPYDPSQAGATVTAAAPVGAGGGGALTVAPPKAPPPPVVPLPTAAATPNRYPDATPGYDQTATGGISLNPQEILAGADWAPTPGAPSTNPLDSELNGASNAEDWRAMGFADGGLLDGQTAIVGDTPGRVTGAEEVLHPLKPKGGRSRVAVEPLSRSKDPVEVMARLHTLMHAHPPSAPGAVRMALGGIFGDPSPDSNSPWGGSQTGRGPSGNQYGADAIGNQPAITALKSGNTGSAFQGIAGGIGNPSLGLLDLPAAPGMQTLNALLPSQQDVVSSAYGQGAGVDYRDILAQAMAASPKGHGRYGDTGRFMGATYGD